MRTDLPVDKLKSPPRIGDLLAQAAGKLGQHVAMPPPSSLGVAVQLGDLARKQRMPLGIKRSNVTLGVLYLPRDPEKFRSSSFASNGRINLQMIIQQALQRLRVAAAIRLIGPCHQQREVPLLVIIARKVRVYALGDIAKERLEARRRIELCSFIGLPERSIMGLLRALASLLGPAACRVGVIKVDLALCNARLQLIKLRIQHADLPKVTAFKSLQLRTNLRKLRFALGKRRANGGKLLALVEQSGLVRALLEDNFGWHAAFRNDISSLAKRSPALREMHAPANVLRASHLPIE
jgi:hypothetical protein